MTAELSGENKERLLASVLVYLVSSDSVAYRIILHQSLEKYKSIKMSAGMPELGSKISLISKADIRYEGRLFTVDPQECTIALANGESL